MSFKFLGLLLGLALLAQLPTASAAEYQGPPAQGLIGDGAAHVDLSRCLRGDHGLLPQRRMDGHLRVSETVAPRDVAHHVSVGFHMTCG